MTEGPKAGMALTCGPLQVIARVHGPQTSYEAKLMGLCVVASPAQPGSSITLDNKAVVDHGPSEPHREASDMDQAAALLRDKHITVRWIPGHRTASAARDAQELDDIHCNNEVDRLAQLATTHPLPLHTPETPPSISVGGTEAPTPASKWIAAVRPYTKYEGLHGTTWLPLRGVRRHMWIQWVWGNVRQSGCSPPWNVVKCCAPCARNDTEEPHMHAWPSAMRGCLFLLRSGYAHGTPWVSWHNTGFLRPPRRT